MAEHLSLAFILVLVGSAFLLPLVYLVWIRNTERFSREPWHAVLRAFAWGAVFSVIIAIVVSLILLNLFQDIGPLYVYLSDRFVNPETILAVLIVAPLAEEAAKALGVRAGKRHVRFRTDGLVYGAAAGLGFSATENVVYGLAVLGEFGAAASLFVIAFRSFSSSLLHASATAVMGYGLAKSWLGASRASVLPFYFVAVLMHGAFNFLASFGEIYADTVGESAHLIAFGATVAFAVVAVTVVRLKLASHRPASGAGP